MVANWSDLWWVRISAAYPSCCFAFGIWNDVILCMRHLRHKHPVLLAVHWSCSMNGVHPWDSKAGKRWIESVSWFELDLQDITHRKPYEVILLAAPPGWRPARPIPDHFVIFAVPGQHSPQAPFVSAARALPAPFAEVPRGRCSLGAAAFYLTYLRSNLSLLECVLQSR